MVLFNYVTLLESSIITFRFHYYFIIQEKQAYVKQLCISTKLSVFYLQITSLNIVFTTFSVEFYFFLPLFFQRPLNYSLLLISDFIKNFYCFTSYILIYFPH